MMEKSNDCYIDVWRDVKFEGERMRIYGPVEYSNMRFLQNGWGDDIGSLRVGPNAFVMAFRDRNFKDEMVSFGPNDEISDLRELRFNDDIDSMKVIESLKIFDHLTKDRNDSPEATVVSVAESPAGSASSGNQNKRRKGKRRFKPG